MTIGPRKPPTEEEIDEPDVQVSEQSPTAIVERFMQHDSVTSSSASNSPRFIQRSMYSPNDDQQGEPNFPVEHLALLEERITNPRWVMPILPDQELEILIDAAADLCRTGDDEKSEPCQRFFRECLGPCIHKIMFDDTIFAWKVNVQDAMYSIITRFIELCVLKLPYDTSFFFDLLAAVFNPHVKFHTSNAGHASDTVPFGVAFAEDYMYARPLLETPRISYGWLTDLINKFGELGGFDVVYERFQTNDLSIQLICVMLRPFGLCCGMLTLHVIKKYFVPIIEKVSNILENLTEEDLKKEAKNDAISVIIRTCRSLIARLPGQEAKAQEFEVLRMKMLLRQLQLSSFNGKMAALNEVNKLITGLSYYPHKSTPVSPATFESEDWLTAEHMAEWIKENHVLEIVLRDSLHQPQYVEKLEKIIRFVAKEQALTMEDLDALWAAQAGKHEVIVKNVHDLFVKLAWDFTAEQLDHLFSCFQASWATASKKQSEKLLELIRKLAEEDKDGVISNKVLNLFWNMAHKEDVTSEILDQALTAHVKILDCTCSQDKEALRSLWIEKCISEIKKNDGWVVPALKLIRDMCFLIDINQRTQHSRYRHDLIQKLEQQYNVMGLVTTNLVAYIDAAQKDIKERNISHWEEYYPDQRYNHNQHVHERLGFLRYMMKESGLVIAEDQAQSIWECLVERALFPHDREACFKWFSKVCNDHPDLDTLISREFFENRVLQLDPNSLTESGMKCLEKLYAVVNAREGRLRPKKKTQAVDLIGSDYLWRVIVNSREDIANRAIQLMKELNSLLCVNFHTSTVFHETHISECVNRLRAHYDTIKILTCEDNIMNQSPENAELVSKQISTECGKMCRVMRLLVEYICECDSRFQGERKFLPVYRASRGRQLLAIIRVSNPGRQVDDYDVSCHGHETVDELKRHLMKRLRHIGTNIKVELYNNGQLLDPAFDQRLLVEVPIRDRTVLTAKVSIIPPGTIRRHFTSASEEEYWDDDEPSYDAGEESCLPGVIMSQNHQIAQFFFQIADKGIELKNTQLRDLARQILRLMPADRITLRNLYITFYPPGVEHMNIMEDGEIPTVEEIFFGLSPSQVLYNLDVLYTLLMPAPDPTTNKVVDFQSAFLNNEKTSIILELFTKNDFLQDADVATKRNAYTVIIRICRIVITALGHFVYRVLDSHQMIQEALFVRLDNEILHRCLLTLKQAFFSMPQHSDQTLRSVASEIAQRCLEETKEALSLSPPQQLVHGIVKDVFRFNIPSIDIIRAIVKIIWGSAAGNLQLLITGVDVEELHLKFTSKHPVMEDITLCKEALEVLTLSMVMNRSALEILYTDKMWSKFVVDLVLITRNKIIRNIASEHLFQIMSFAPGRAPLVNCAENLFNALNSSIPTEKGVNSSESFQLLSRLLGFMQLYDIPLPDIEQRLETELIWLREFKNQMKKTGVVESGKELLEGHLGLIKELVSMLDVQKKCYYGSDEHAEFCLIKMLLEDFLFPDSRLMAYLDKPKELLAEKDISMCQTDQCVDICFEILVTLCRGCIANLHLLVKVLVDLFYSDRDDPMLEWEFCPTMGCRPPNGFVGLKNAGATCYMNSVLQQLFMIDSIRYKILSIEAFSEEDYNEDLLVLNAEEKIELEQQQCDNENEEKSNDEQFRRDYYINIVKQIQVMFGYLAHSKLQFYIPQGFWKHFRLQGEVINLKEQQDAVEFFMNLVESIDEGLKALGIEQFMTGTLGGSFSDQKICKECPHRYFREEPFCILNVDIRNQSNLLESLEQYVKGELLEGVDAYHCDKCNKKVVTVKRLCVKKLPRVLAIQLKRFEYDFERVCPIKFNDYFEFPRFLDMEPYTASGLAKMEGEVIHIEETENGEETDETEVCTKYQLTGVVVHSGQATGGHYFSYIMQRRGENEVKWFKFDDGEVTECHMEEDEELKTFCFGGDCMGDVYDHVTKRMSYRRQKRWWNAYILFYTRLDVQQEPVIYKDPVPHPIEINIKRQNTRFMHVRGQLSERYSQFVKKMSVSNNNAINRLLQSVTDADLEELSLLTTQLLSNFVFRTVLHGKKYLRGGIIEWMELLSLHLKSFRHSRAWFIVRILLRYPRKFYEYLMYSPLAEIKAMFVKLLVHLAHYTLHDPVPETDMLETIGCNEIDSPLSDSVLISVLQLLYKDLQEFARNASHCFSIFYMYCMLGIPEKAHLIRLNILTLFIYIALDSTNNPYTKYQSLDMNKCMMTVSVLIRSCDVSFKCITAKGEFPRVPNPHGEYSNGEYVMRLPEDILDLLYTKQGFIKRIIEEVHCLDEMIRLMHFLCWENPHVSKYFLNEFHWHINYCYCPESKHVGSLLIACLVLDDSWQKMRLVYLLKGSENREGIFDIIQRNKANFPKRSYHCVKYLVLLFVKSPAAAAILKGNPEFRKRWWSAIEWLYGEIHMKKKRNQYIGSSEYAYTNWTTSAQSNDNTTGYALERSNSAKRVLDKGLEFCQLNNMQLQRLQRRVNQQLDDESANEDSDEGENDESLAIRGAINPSVTILYPTKNEMAATEDNDDNYLLRKLNSIAPAIEYGPTLRHHQCCNSPQDRAEISELIETQTIDPAAIDQLTDKLQNEGIFNSPSQINTSPVSDEAPNNETNSATDNTNISPKTASTTDE